MAGRTTQAGSDALAVVGAAAAVDTALVGAGSSVEPG
jgi:hypothetical protein